MPFYSTESPIFCKRSKEEIWKWVVGYVGRYMVSNRGRVKSVARTVTTRRGIVRKIPERILKQVPNSKWGHLYVGLWKNTGRNQNQPYLVHTLVLTAFVGPRPAGKICRHLDGNGGNNNLENLCWGTPAENEGDKIRHGRTNRGERNGRSILKEKKVRELIDFHNTGKYTQIQLSKMLKINKGTVGDILHGRSWKHLQLFIKPVKKTK